MKKIIIILGIAFALGYFGGFGFLLDDEPEVQATTGDYITKISYTTESKTHADPEQIQKMANILQSSFKYPNGATGQLTYFWNGKATDIDPSTGLDNRFGAIAKETDKDGDISYKKYGLDCSGFTTYVMWLSGVKDFPHGSQNQYNDSEEITVAEAVTGDLVFIETAGTTEHVGIVAVEGSEKYTYEICPQGVKKKVLEVGSYWTSIRKNKKVVR